MSSLSLYKEKARWAQGKTIYNSKLRKTGKECRIILLRKNKFKLVEKDKSQSVKAFLTDIKK